VTAVTAVTAFLGVQELFFSAEKVPKTESTKRVKSGV
jgi:hypothetical protein